MDPVDCEDASLCQQRNRNLVYQRDIHDMGVTIPHSFYSDAGDCEGETQEYDDPELTRKMNVLRDIEERILHKKAAILLKSVEMINKKPTPDSKDTTLRDRVTTILEQRHSLDFLSKFKTYWSPTESDDSPSHSTELLEDHPLKLRVEALLRHRYCDPNGFTSNNQDPDHEMATPPVTPPPPSESITSQIQDGDVANKGFERFLSLLNKGVDMDLLSRIVSDDSEELHLGDTPLNSQHSGVRGDLDRPTSSESFQCSSGPQLPQNGGEKTVLSASKQYPRESQSLSDEDKNGKDKRDRSSGSSSGSKSPPIMEKTKKEKEMVEVSERHKQLQNILNTLGLSLEMEDLSKLTDRTQERLYGKRNEIQPVIPSTTEQHSPVTIRQPVTPSTTEQHSPVTTSPSRKCDRELSPSSSSSSSFSHSRSYHRSPSYRQLSHGRESEDRREKESLLKCGGSRKSRENLSLSYTGTSQDDRQAWKTVGKNDADILDEIPYFHSHCDPSTSFACPDYSLPHSSHYDTSYSGDTKFNWTSAPDASIIPNCPYSRAYSTVTDYPNNTIPSGKHDRHFLQDVALVNPDLSRSEGQCGSISGPRYLQVVNMKRPDCMPKKRVNNRVLKPIKEHGRDVQTSSAHWASEVPFEAKETKAPVTKVKRAHGRKDKSKKQRTLTEEEIKANLRKKLEAFNQMSKNKSHAQPNPLS